MWPPPNLLQQLQVSVVLEVPELDPALQVRLQQSRGQDPLSCRLPVTGDVCPNSKTLQTGNHMVPNYLAPTAVSVKYLPRVLASCEVIFLSRRQLWTFVVMKGSHLPSCVHPECSQHVKGYRYGSSILQDAQTSTEQQP